MRYHRYFAYTVAAIYGLAAVVELVLLASIYVPRFGVVTPQHLRLLILVGLGLAVPAFFTGGAFIGNTPDDPRILKKLGDHTLLITLGLLVYGGLLLVIDLELATVLRTATHACAAIVLIFGVRAGRRLARRPLWSRRR